MSQGQAAREKVHSSGSGSRVCLHARSPHKESSTATPHPLADSSSLGKQQRTFTEE